MRAAALVRQQDPEAEHQAASRAVDDLVVGAEFCDPIYPGLVSTGKVERGRGRPSYTVINANGKLSGRVLEILMSNVSTRNYERVIAEVADTVGVSKSSVSRNFIEQGGRELKRLAERRFDDPEFLVI